MAVTVAWNLRSIHQSSPLTVSVWVILFGQDGHIVRNISKVKAKGTEQNRTKAESRRDEPRPGWLDNVGLIHRSVCVPVCLRIRWPFWLWYMAVACSQ